MMKSFALSVQTSDMRFLKFVLFPENLLPGKIPYACREFSRVLIIRAYLYLFYRFSILRCLYNSVYTTGIHNYLKYINDKIPNR